jgi:hypothetical protein
MCSQRLRRKSKLQVLPDEANLPTRIAQQSGAHEVFSRVHQRPASDVDESASFDDESGSGAHCGIETIIQGFEDGEPDIELCLLA